MATKKGAAAAGEDGSDASGAASKDVTATVFTSLLESILGGVESFTLAPGKTGVVMQAATATGSGEVRIPTLSVRNLPEDGVVLDFKAFVGACKGRKAVSLSAKGSSSELEVSSGSYRAAIATTEVAGSGGKDSSASGGSGSGKTEYNTSVSLDDSCKALLSSALRSTRIEKTYSGIVDTVVHVDATDKAVTIACFEPSQVAYKKVKNKDGNFPTCSFVLPSSIISKVLLLPGTVKLSVNDAMAVMRSKSCDVTFPLPIDTINAISTDQVKQLIKTAKTSASKEFTIGKASLQSFLLNAESVLVSSADVSVSPADGKGVILSVTTAKGTVKEKFKGSIGKKFSLNFPFFRAAAGRAGGGGEDDILRIGVTDAFVMMDNSSDNSSYIAALSE